MKLCPASGSKPGTGYGFLPASISSAWGLALVVEVGREGVVAPSDREHRHERQRRQHAADGDRREPPHDLRPACGRARVLCPGVHGGSAIRRPGDRL